MERMERHVPAGLLIATIHRRIVQAVGLRVRSYRLTPRQFWILVRLYEEQGCALGELAEGLRMGEPTASRAVATLAARKLLRAEVDPEDRRRARLSLTAEGRRLGQELHPLALEVRHAVEAGLSATERALLRTLLGKLLANVDRFRHRHGPARALTLSRHPGSS